MRRAPRPPIRKFELDDADRVLGELGHAARLLADAGVDRLDAGEGEHAPLDLADEEIFFIERKVAAGVDDHLAVVRLDVREELDAAAKSAIGHLHRDQKQGGKRERRAGVAQGEPHRAHVGTAILGALVMRHWRRLAQKRAEGGREEQRHRERS